MVIKIDKLDGIIKDMEGSASKFSQFNGIMQKIDKSAELNQLNAETINKLVIDLNQINKKLNSTNSDIENAIDIRFKKINQIIELTGNKQKQVLTDITSKIDINHDVNLGLLNELKSLQDNVDAKQDQQIKVIEQIKTKQSTLLQIIERQDEQITKLITANNSQRKVLVLQSFLVTIFLGLCSYKFFF